MQPTEIIKVVDAAVVVEATVAKAIPILTSGGLLSKFQLLGLLLAALPALETVVTLNLANFKTQLAALPTDAVENQAVLTEIASITSQEGVAFGPVVTNVITLVESVYNQVMAAVGPVASLVNMVKGWISKL